MNNKHCLRVGENSNITKLKSRITEQAGASARTVKIGGSVCATSPTRDTYTTLC